jgi:molybdopterin biosynthesis enzyme
MSKMSDIQKALEQTTTARAPAPLTVVETAALPTKIRPSVAPSRQGRVHIGAYLPADFKRGIRMLQAATGEDLQSILARVLNEQFRLHSLPEVGPD